MRYDQFGDMGHPLDRMAHKFNMTVPGILGYKPQKADLQEDLEKINPGGSFVAEGDLSSPYHSGNTEFDSFGNE